MLTEQGLQDLIAFRPQHPVLSVYINTDISTAAPDHYKLTLRQMLKEFHPHAQPEIENIQRFIEHEYDWSGRSLAIFSCAKENFFDWYPLYIPIRNRARLLNRPYVKPLVQLLDLYGHYGVALVDLQGARLFHFHMGALQEQEGTVGESVRQVKQGGGSQAAGRRSGTAGQTRFQEEVTGRNLKEAARFSIEFFRENHVRRILLGGTEPTVARFRELLPKVWQSLIAGTLSLPMTASVPQILEKATAIVQRADQEHETRIIKAVITAAAKGKEGVIQLDKTLSAVHAGQVHTLVVDEGYSASGYRCSGCGYLTVKNLDACVYCGSPLLNIPDAVELAIRRVLMDGGDVEFIHDSPQFTAAGRIGALLRY